MRTDVAILHHDYPARVRETVEEKLSHLAKFFDRVVSIRAMLERQNDDHRVELVANVGRGQVYVTEGRSGALTSSLDLAVERMARHLKRHHDKLTRERHRNGRNHH